MLEDLSCKAKRAINSINSKIILHFLSVKALLKLFDGWFKLYGGELWVPLNQDDEKGIKTRLKKVNFLFMKDLGLSRSTGNTNGKW